MSRNILWCQVYLPLKKRTMAVDGFNKVQTGHSIVFMSEDVLDLEEELKEEAACFGSAVTNQHVLNYIYKKIFCYRCTTSITSF